MVKILWAIPWLLQVSCNMFNQYLFNSRSNEHNIQWDTKYKPGLQNKLYISKTKVALYSGVSTVYILYILNIKVNNNLDDIYKVSTAMFNATIQKKKIQHVICNHFTWVCFKRNSTIFTLLFVFLLWMWLPSFPM